ncbi:MAG: right-handed parallel beta-helix repeat-containing protein, partial [Salinigranum sp.]
MSREQTTSTRVSRRALLGIGAGVAAAVSVVGRASGSSGSYDSVIDVTDEGADDTGGEPINDVLERLRA